MGRLLLLTVLTALITAGGCALPDWELPKPPQLELQGSSDDYSESKWSRKGSR